MWLRLAWELIKARIRVARSRKAGKNDMAALVDAIRKAGRIVLVCGVLGASGCRSLDGAWVWVGERILPEDVDVQSVDVTVEHEDTKSDQEDGK